MKELVEEPMATRVELHPFFAGMDHKQLGLITDCAIPAEFRKGEVILRQGERAKQFYVIETGKVSLETEDDSGQAVVVDTIGAGELLGWSWMFPSYAWRFTARAIEPTRAIILYGEILRQYCERDHLLGYELFKRMTPIMLDRLQKARERMVAVHAGAISLKPALPTSPFQRGRSLEGT